MDRQKNSALAKWLHRLDKWHDAFDHDVRDLQFDVLMLASHVIDQKPEWLRSVRHIEDLPGYNANIGDDHPVFLCDLSWKPLSIRLKMAEIHLFLVENDFDWRVTGQDKAPILYFNTESDKTRFLLSVPAALISYS